MLLSLHGLILVTRGTAFYNVCFLSEKDGVAVEMSLFTAGERLST